jgi:hypothetical protein
MNICALTAISGSNCFAARVRQTKMPPVPGVAIAVEEYCQLSLPFPRAVKEYLLPSAEARLAVHALPQAVTRAKHSCLVYQGIVLVNAQNGRQSGS